MPSEPEISDAQRNLAMVSIHAHAYWPDADFSDTSLLSLEDAVDILDRDSGMTADSRARRAAANLWVHKYDHDRPEFSKAVARLLRRAPSVSIVAVDQQLGKALADRTPPIAFPPSPVFAAVVEPIVSNLLIGLTQDCPYQVPPSGPYDGVGTNPTLVSWSYDIPIPRAMADIARSLDPQSWDVASSLFYDSYLVDTPPSCCPHTPSSDCTCTTTATGDPSKGTAHPAGQPYGYTAFFENFCAGSTCPNCQGPKCVAAFKNLLCVRTKYDGAWVFMPCLAKYASSYSVSYHLATSISGSVYGADPGSIIRDEGTLSVRPATATEMATLAGNTWSIVHVDKELVFRSSGMTTAMSQALQSFEKELHDQIVDQACHDVPAQFWFSWLSP